MPKAIMASSGCAEDRRERDDPSFAESVAEVTTSRRAKLCGDKTTSEFTESSTKSEKLIRTWPEVRGAKPTQPKLRKDKEGPGCPKSIANSSRAGHAGLLISEMDPECA